jgi:LysR family glycine cleavage system transcriptional activator
MRRLPNLNAVRAFDAAARHGSFSAAADELGVSHAAVSRHVRNLEAELGVELFERHARHVVLTGEGSLFARTAATALSSLEVGTGRMRRGGAGTVVLDVESDFATRWLMPRLAGGALDAMGINVDLRVRPDPPRSVLGDADLAVTWGQAYCTGYRSRPFLSFFPVVVAAPDLIARGPAPEDPAFFLSHRLIHERGLYWWKSFLDLMGLSVEDADRHLFLNRSHLCMDAAVRGLGLAIGDDIMCREYLEQGRLKTVPGPTMRPRDRYFLLEPEAGPLSRPARIVRDWLMAEADGQARYRRSLEAAA